MAIIPPKVVGILCSLQVLMIIGSVLICRTMLKVYNTAVVPSYSEMPYRFNWVLRSCLMLGPWMLLVPLTWGIIATSRADRESRVPHISPVQTKFGYAVTLLLLIVCFLASARALNLAFGPIPMSRISLRWQ